MCGWMARAGEGSVCVHTSKSTLKVRVETVGHVKSRGKTMWIGMAHPWQMGPSAIWMFWISVASRAIPSA